MMGVRFTKVVYPWNVGDTALLPDPAAKIVIGNGEAEAYNFPSSPHAAGMGEVAPPTIQRDVREFPQQTYRTKRK